MKAKFRLKKFFVFLSLFLVSSVVLVSSIIVKYHITNSKLNTLKSKQNTLIAYIDGAVEYPGEYVFKNGDRYIELLRKASLKVDANLENIDLTRVIKNNEKVFIPYIKSKKFNLKDVNNADFFIKLGIKSNIAKKIYLYIKEKEIKNWKEVLNISGVGEKTYDILEKNILI